VLGGLTRVGVRWFKKRQLRDELVSLRVVEQDNPPCDVFPDASSLNPQASVCGKCESPQFAFERPCDLREIFAAGSELVDHAVPRVHHVEVPTRGIAGFGRIVDRDRRGGAVDVREGEGACRRARAAQHVRVQRGEFDRVAVGVELGDRAGGDVRDVHVTRGFLDRDPVGVGERNGAGAPTERFEEGMRFGGQRRGASSSKPHNHACQQ
jgi:hypothetical protein